MPEDEPKQPIITLPDLEFPVTGFPSVSEAKTYHQSGSILPVGQFGGAVLVSSSIGTDVSELKKEIAAANAQFVVTQKQLAAVQEQLTQNANTGQLQALQTQVAALAQSLAQGQVQLSQAQARTEVLTAPVILPTSKDMQVQLVPMHWIDRLEEYRSDGGIFQLLAGLFAGAILGILVNWATNEMFTVTRISLVFIGVFVVVLAGLGFFAYRSWRRANKLREQMRRFNDGQHILTQNRGTGSEGNNP